MVVEGEETTFSLGGRNAGFGLLGFRGSYEKRFDLSVVEHAVRL